MRQALVDCWEFRAICSITRGIVAKRPATTAHTRVSWERLPPPVERVTQSSSACIGEGAPSRGGDGSGRAGRGRRNRARRRFARGRRTAALSALRGVPRKNATRAIRLLSGRQSFPPIEAGIRRSSCMCQGRRNGMQTIPRCGSPAMRRRLLWRSPYAVACRHSPT